MGRAADDKVNAMVMWCFLGLETVGSVSELNSYHSKATSLYSPCTIVLPSEHEKNPHLINEIADLCVLSNMLALNQDASKVIFKTRFQKFKDKIASD